MPGVVSQQFNPDIFHDQHFYENTTINKHNYHMPRELSIPDITINNTFPDIFHEDFHIPSYMFKEFNNTFREYPDIFEEMYNQGYMNEIPDIFDEINDHISDNINNHISDNINNHIGGHIRKNIRISQYPTVIYERPQFSSVDPEIVTVPGYGPNIYKSSSGTFDGYPINQNDDSKKHKSSTSSLEKLLSETYANDTSSSNVTSAINTGNQSMAVNASTLYKGPTSNKLTDMGKHVSVTLVPSNSSLDLGPSSSIY